VGLLCKSIATPPRVRDECTCGTSAEKTLNSAGKPLNSAEKTLNSAEKTLNSKSLLAVTMQTDVNVNDSFGYSRVNKGMCDAPYGRELF
jgi:hypothetical protein